MQLPLPKEGKEKPPCKAAENPSVEAALTAGVTLPPPGTAPIQLHILQPSSHLLHALYHRPQPCRQEKAALATQRAVWRTKHQHPTSHHPQTELWIGC